MPPVIDRETPHGGAATGVRSPHCLVHRLPVRILRTLPRDQEMRMTTTVDTTTATIMTMGIAMTMNTATITAMNLQAEQT